MKKAFLLLICLSMFVLTISGCRTKNENTIEIDEKTIEIIENTTQITIGYGFSSYAALITDQEEIKQLEDLFSGKEFAESDTSIQQPHLTIAFGGEKSSTSFYIDHNDVIQLRDGYYIKSEQINFKKLHAIFDKYSKK